MKKTKITLIVLLFILNSLLIYAGTYVMPWYEVDDWEIEECSKWGGTESAETISSGTVGYSNMDSASATLQSSRKNLPIDEETFTYIYEVAWYYHPIDESKTYKIRMIGPTKTENIYEATASDNDGDSGYHAFESTEDFTYAQMIHEDGQFKVPVVEKE